jgi:3D (Asp-Asp-Asp) domain-containing protein
MRKIKLFTNKNFGIFVCTFALIIPIAGNLYNYYIHKQRDIIHNINQFKISQPMELLRLCNYDVQIEEMKKEPEESKAMKVIVTAYDLSIISTGKSKSHPAYGISRGNIDLRGKTINSRYIATDPKVIPLGSKVKIKFIDEKYKKYDGIYISSDTGSAIKGKKIDLYLGENKYNECLEFGKTYALVEIIKE